MSVGLRTRDTSRPRAGNRGGMIAIGVLMIAPLLAVMVGAWWAEFTAGRDCLMYVDRAAHAPNLQVTIDSLSAAIIAAEDRGWTRGSTALVFESPEYDVGFWHENLRRCNDDVRAARAEGTQLTASNTLMRLREVLSKVPPYLAYYPHRWAWVVAAIVSLLFAAFGVLIIVVAFTD